MALQQDLEVQENNADNITDPEEKKKARSRINSLRKVIEERSAVSQQSLADIARDRIGWVTPFPQDLVRTLRQTDGMPTEVAQLAQNVAELTLESHDFRGNTYTVGQVAPGPAPTRNPVLEPLIKTQEDGTELVEGYGDYINRVLLHGSTSATIDMGNGNIVRVGTEIPATQLLETLRTVYGEETVQEFLGLVPLFVVKRNGRYIPTNNRFRYKRLGKTWSPAEITNELNERDGALVMSSQELIEKITNLFNLGLAAGKTGGVSDSQILGAYNAASRLIAIGGWDVTTFGHELFHAIADAGFRTGKVPAAATKDLVRLAKDSGMQLPSAEEGAAEFGAIFINGAAFTAADGSTKGLKEDYPEAHKYMRETMQGMGIWERMLAAQNAVVNRNNATPEQRLAARIKLASEKRETKGFTFGNLAQRAAWNVYGANVDQHYSLRAGMKHITGIDRADRLIDDAYEMKQLESGWTSAAQDNLNGGFHLDIRTDERSISWADVVNELTEQGITDENVKEFWGYMSAMNTLDRNPLERRAMFKKRKIDEALLGDWATSENIDSLVDVFDTVEEIEQENQQSIAAWKRLAAVAKKTGLPEPPKPYLWAANKAGFKLFDPSRSSADQTSIGLQKTDVTSEDLNDMADTVAQHDKNSPFFRVNLKLQEFYRSFDDWRVRNGDLSSADLARHRMIEYYLPQRTQTTHTGKAKTLGTSGDIIDPLESTVDKVMKATERVFRNNTTSAWYRTVQTELLKSDLAADERGNLTRFAQIRTSDQLRISELAKKNQLSEDTEKLILMNVDKTTAEFMVANGLHEQVLNRNDSRVIAAVEQSVAGDGTALVQLLLGRQLIYRVADPKIFQSLSREGIMWSSRANPWLSIPAKVIRKLSTTFNPQFLAQTFMRTPLESFVQGEGSRNPIPFVSSTITAHMDTWNAIMRGEVNPEMSRYFQTGAPGSSFFTENMNVEQIMTRTDMAKALSRYGNNHPKGFGWLSKSMSFMERVSDVTEQSNRKAQFDRIVAQELIARGKQNLAELDSEQDAREILTRAGRAAQEVNINFGRSGTLGGQMNQFIPFFNAAIQGTNRGLEVLMGGSALSSRNLGQRAVASSFVFGFLFLPALFQHIVLGDDDEVRDEFDDIPDIRKQLFWHIPMGADDAGRPRFFTFPKPPGILGAISTGFQEIFAINPRDWRDTGMDIFAESVPQTFLPVAFQIPMEIMTGKQLDIGTGSRGAQLRGIMPSRLEGVSPDLQDAPWTSPTAYMMHEAFALVVGEDNAMPPATIDYLFNSYTGGIGMLATDVPDAIANISGWKDRASYSPGDLPMVRLLMARDSNWGRRSIGRFYDIVAHTDPARKEIKALERRVTENRMTPTEMQDRIAADPDLRFAAGVNEELSGVRVLFGQAKTAWERINNDTTKTVVERKILMDELLEKMINAANTVVKAVDGKAVDHSVNFDPRRRRR